MEPVELFFSYSHKDEKLRDKLEPHLAMLKRDQVIKAWHDRKISAGTEWAQAIDEHLNSADIILLLISADFLASDYCYDLEMKRAMERHEAGEARVIPIILKAVDNWYGAPFAKLQAFPKDAKPVIQWKPQNDAFVNIAQGIRQAATEMAEILASRRSVTAQPPVSLPTPKTIVADASAGGLPVSPVELEEVGGQVPLGSVFYVNRPPMEERCFAAIAKPGALIRIKAPRQMGKSSLMLRMMQSARERGEQAAALNFQYAERDCLGNLDQFLQWFCLTLTDQLGLEERLADYWKGSLGCKNKCTNYLQRYLLPEIKTAIALCLDEVDEIFQHPEIATDFFGMLRAWHEEAKVKPIWRNLRLVIVHSKEVYIPLNINQSPFNVGLPIDLPPLTPEQVQDVAQRHGLAWSEAEVAELMAMVGGHPFLVRVALQAIARDGLSLAQVLAVAPTEGGLFGEHLRRHLLNLEGDPELLAAMKQVLAADEPVAINTTEAFKLVSMGVVRYEGNRVLPLCDLYRQYFRDRLVAGGGSPQPSAVALPRSDRASSPQDAPEIYLSYAWGGDSEALVNQLDQAFQAQGVMIVRDKRDLGYKGLIQEFMERIGRGKCVVTVISDKYLKSPNCMFELVQIAQNGRFYDRIFPIVLPDAQIYRPIERIKYIKHWEDQIKELDEAMRSVGSANLHGFREEIDQYTQIRNTIAELTGILKNMNTLNTELHQAEDFGVLRKAIADKLAE